MGGMLIEIAPNFSRHEFFSLVSLNREPLRYEVKQLTRFLDRQNSYGRFPRSGVFYHHAKTGVLSHVVLIHGPGKQDGKIAEHVPLPHRPQLAFIEESSNIEFCDSVDRVPPVGGKPALKTSPAFPQVRKIGGALAFALLRQSSFDGLSH